MRNLPMILLTSLLTACTVATPQAARELGPERRYIFQVDVDYQTVYQRILDLSRKCHQYPIGTAMQMAQGDLYPDKQSGTITVGLYGALGPALYQIIDVRAVGKATTEVAAVFPIGPVDKPGSRLKPWADGTGVEC